MYQPQDEWISAQTQVGHSAGQQGCFLWEQIFFLMGTAVWPEVYCHVVFLNLAKGSQLLLVMTHLILLSALLHRSLLITINLDLESRLLSGGCR